MDATNLAESTTRIKELHEVEKKLVLLVETAGDALGVLSDDGRNDEETDAVVRERVEAFRALAARYFSLVNDIQLALRSNVRFLRNTGSIAMSTTKSIPFRATVAGQQKELEVWTAAVGTIHQRVEELKRIAHEQHEPS